MTPPKRRPRGTGGLTYRESDGMWIGRVEFGYTPQGTRDRRTVSSKRKAEAQRKLRDLVLERNRGGTGRNPRITVKAWADKWLPDHLATVSPNTQPTDRGAVNKWIIPVLGHRRIAELTPADVRALRNAIVGAGRSSTTAATYQRIFLKMLKDADAEGIEVPGRVLRAKTAKNAVNDRLDIPVDQALRVLKVVGQRADSSRWLFSMLYGVRQGEALGLTWDAVDFDAAVVVIEWQLQPLTKDHVQPDGYRAKHLTGRMWLTETKTEQGERGLPLVPLMAASLAAHRETWQPNPWGLVWTLDGKPISDDRDRAAWKTIQSEAGVAHPTGRPWHLHECRHTVITLLKRAGVDDAVIERIVGQSKLVKKYLHLVGEDSRTAMEGLSETLRIEP